MSRQDRESRIDEWAALADASVPESVELPDDDAGRGTSWDRDAGER